MRLQAEEMILEGDHTENPHDGCFMAPPKLAQLESFDVDALVGIGVREPSMRVHATRLH